MPTGIGIIQHDIETHTAHCAFCPWEFETAIDGEAAKELTKHNTKEHRNVE